MGCKGRPPGNFAGASFTPARIVGLVTQSLVSKNTPARGDQHEHARVGAWPPPSKPAGARVRVHVRDRACHAETERTSE